MVLVSFPSPMVIPHAITLLTTTTTITSPYSYYPLCTSTRCCSPDSISLLTKGAGPRNPQQQSLLDQLSAELENDKGHKLFRPSIRVLSSSLSSVQDVTQVDALLHGLHFPLPVFCTVIRKLGSSKKIQAAFSVYEWLQQRDLPEERPDVFIYSSMLGVLSSSGKFEFLSKVVGEMKTSGVEPDLVAYKIIITSYEHVGLHHEAMAAFGDLEQKGLMLNTSTLRALLKGSEKSNDIHGALRLYSAAMKSNPDDDAIVEFKVRVSSIAYRSIRSLLLGHKSSHHILDLVQNIENTISELCPGDYQGIIWACGSGPEDHIVARSILARRRLNSYPVSVPLCNHVMMLLGKARKWRAALEVFEQMLDEGPSPGKDSYAIIRSHFNSLLSSSRDTSNSNWSVQLLEKMEAHGIMPDRYAWDTTLVTCAKKPDPVAAVLVFQKMVERGQNPSLLAYGALLTSLEKSSLLERAEQVWHHMKRLGIKPNIEAYTIMISVYSSSLKQEELMGLVEEMRASEVEFTLITYNALLTSCAKLGDGRGALKWMKQLIDDGFNPDTTTYDQLVKALSQGGEAELARDMCMEAKRLQMVLSQAAYNAAVEACKMHDIAFDLDVLGLASCNMQSD